MSAIRRVAGLKAISRISVRNAANALKAVSAGHLRNSANLLKDIAGAGGMTVTADPDAVYGYGNSSGVITVTTGLTTVTVSGGTPPYSYSWVTAGTSSPVSPTLQYTNFRFTGMGPGDHQDDTAICTVTDARGNPADSNTVTIIADNYGT